MFHRPYTLEVIDREPNDPLPSTEPRPAGTQLPRAFLKNSVKVRGEAPHVFDHKFLYTRQPWPYSYDWVRSRVLDQLSQVGRYSDRSLTRAMEARLRLFLGEEMADLRLEDREHNDRSVFWQGWLTPEQQLHLVTAYPDRTLEVVFYAARCADGEQMGWDGTIPPPARSSTNCASGTMNPCAGPAGPDRARSRPIRGCMRCHGRDPERGPPQLHQGLLKSRRRLGWTSLGVSPWAPQLRTRQAWPESRTTPQRSKGRCGTGRPCPRRPIGTAQVIRGR